ncbi:MAG: type II toxin-antitoxin system HicA family toxin [Chloroflexota bacterium]|nr:type II toxin-antitoxin system HicA family toxin [Chloroflexota bacterium]MDE2941944.1 type II toxin-antitoxin system HicA family toxin [Chloroflexota bacterium]MDE3268619.1 type II toxin-antitoxin system HicA family toxin [Chloroflexota bacterium]
MPLRPLRSREIIARIERAGFSFSRQRGSHAHFRDQQGRRVTVPIHTGDIRVPVIRNILLQAGLTEEEWEQL